MAYTNLKSMFVAICDAIREQDGTTALISHQTIPERILNIHNVDKTFVPTIPVIRYSTDAISYRQED